MKNREKLVFPSKDVIIICKTTEQIIRENNHILFKQENIKHILLAKTFHRVNVNHSIFTNVTMIEHIKNQGVLNNHKTLLIKEIIKIYLVIRLHHEGKRATGSEKQEYIRHKYTKLILFKSQ